jgi:hypothetical protein
MDCQIHKNTCSQIGLQERFLVKTSDYLFSVIFKYAGYLQAVEKMVFPLKNCVHLVKFDSM